jgi:hypothetical protein
MGTDLGRYALSQLAIIDSDAFKFIEDVAELAVRGKTEYQIARELGVKVIEARTAMEQWKDMLARDMDSRDVAKDYLNKLVVHYDQLIQMSYDNLHDLQTLVFSDKISAQINATIKNIADFEKSRTDLLQKAGILDAHDLGDELAEREEREAMLISILQNDLCDDCKETVRDKLTQLTGQVQGTVIESEVVHE